MPRETPVARWYDMDPGYFKTMGIPLLEGRYFDAADDSTPELPVGDREPDARRAGSSLEGRGYAVGGQIELERRGPVEVIGVVPDVRPFRPDAES